MKRSARVFIEPRSANEDDRRREYILNIILAGSIVALIFFECLVVYYATVLGVHPTGVSDVWFAILPAFFIFLYALSRRGFFVPASYFLIAAYFAANSYAAYGWGASLPTSLLGYALLIIIASILISTRFGFFVTAVVGCYLAVLWHLQLNGILMPFKGIRFTDGDVAALVVLYGLIMVVAWLSNREIEKSLLRARRSERELKEERDSLEVKVEERTRELHAAELEKVDHLYRFAEFGQLASGLFHDLLNMVQVVSLRGEEEGETQKLLEQASSVQVEIDRFRNALRTQLSRDDTKQRFSLDETIQDAVQFLSYQAKYAGVRIGVACDRVEYFGSPLKFHQIVMNLVLNAIEAFEGDVGKTKDGKRVAIRLVLDSDKFIILSVADNGCGISTDVQAKIFDPFFTTKHGAKQGTGIGLAIAKRIVENDFGGTIEVQSAERGLGSIFNVRFPLIYEPIESIPVNDRAVSRYHQKLPTS